MITSYQYSNHPIYDNPIYQFKFWCTCPKIAEHVLKSVKYMCDNIQLTYIVSAVHIFFFVYWLNWNIHGVFYLTNIWVLSRRKIGDDVNTRFSCRLFLLGRIINYWDTDWCIILYRVYFILDEMDSILNYRFHIGLRLFSLYNCLFVLY